MGKNFKFSCQGHSGNLGLRTEYKVNHIKTIMPTNLFRYYIQFNLLFAHYAGCHHCVKSLSKVFISDTYFIKSMLCYVLGNS